jgi:pyruvate/2-oxoglutarate dehydrogenase complex dihydrolipoamide acyltransferase (E2) component
MSEDIGNYETEPFPKEREIIIDMNEIGANRHHMKGLFELDVTEGRNIIHSYEQNTGQDISFTAWIMKCIATAIQEHKHVQAVRKGKKEVVIFDDVDISLPIERRLKNEAFPFPLVIRKTNHKSVREITGEIRKAQAEDTQEIEVMGSEKKSLTMRLLKHFPSFPKIIRKLFYRKFRDPFFLKENVGTVFVTSIGMFSRSGGYAIPLPPYPLVFAIGGIAEKPGVIDGRIEVRDFLSITVLVDHDTVDGAPAARFISRFAELVEGAYGLDNLS